MKVTDRARIIGPNAKRADHKSEQKKRGSVTYSTDRENDVSKMFSISLGSKRWRQTLNLWGYAQFIWSFFARYNSVFKCEDIIDHHNLSCSEILRILA